jgi:hypothetical protein
MKRAVIAIALAAVIGTGIYGLAASLNVTSDTLGAGSAAVAACQSGTINVTWASTYSSSVPGYQATTVTLNGIDTTSTPTNCGGKAYKVVVTDASNAVLGSEATGTLPSSGTTKAITLTGVSAASVANVHVTITG